MKDTEDKIVGDGVGFQRIRRITGYLVGTIDRWNDAKRAEERDRVKHMMEKTSKVRCPLHFTSKPTVLLSNVSDLP